MRRCLATCFYLGELPLMPGTWGTFPAVVLYLLHQNFLYPSLILVPFVLATCIVAVPLGNWAERTAGTNDPKWFCLDEFVGYLVTVLFLRVGSPYATATCASSISSSRGPYGVWRDCPGAGGFFSTTSSPESTRTSSSN